MFTKYKVYLTSERTINRVYDIINDPFEKNNIVGHVQKKDLEEIDKLIKSLPESDQNPKYSPLKHNPAWDIKKDELNLKDQKKRSNYNVFATQEEYESFVSNSKQRRH